MEPSSKRVCLPEICFDELPDELVLEIFKLLPFHQRVTLLPLVCKRWSKLSRDSSLFRSIDFQWFRVKYGAADTREVLRFLRTVLPRRLDMDHTIDLDLFTHTAAEHAATLTSFKLRGRGRGEDGHFLPKLFEALPNLTHLELLLVNMMSLRVAKAVVKTLRKLKGLHFRISWRVEEIFSVLFKPEGRGPHLEELNIFLHQGNFYWETVRLLRICTSLKVFCLEYTWTQERYPIEEILTNFTQLEELQLADSNLQYFPCKYEHNESLQKSFRSLNRLRHVTLQNFYVTDTDIETLCRSSGKTLESLIIEDRWWEFYSHGLSDNCLQIIVNNCPRLVHLGICGRNIVGASISNLNLAALMPTLFFLDFKNCNPNNYFGTIAINNPSIVIRVQDQFMNNPFFQLATDYGDDDVDDDDEEEEEEDGEEEDELELVELDEYGEPRRRRPRPRRRRSSENFEKFQYELKSRVSSKYFDFI